MFKLTYELLRAYCDVGSCYIDSCRYKYNSACPYYQEKPSALFEGCIHAKTDRIFIGTEAETFEYCSKNGNGDHGTLKINGGEEVHICYLSVDGKMIGVPLYEVDRRADDDQSER